MLRRLAAPALLLLLLNVVTPTFADDKGWTSLFNGRDLTGWKVYPNGTGDWKVVDGAITGSGKASHLFTERGDFTNFVYRMEISINEGGNSGQYVRAVFEGGFPQGYEAQINATHRDTIRTGSLYPSKIGKLSPETRKKLIVLDPGHKPNEWFVQEVTAEGNHIVIKVNGKTTVDYVDENKSYMKGHFAIQHHDPGCVVKIRKVEVKELPATK